MDVSLHFFTRGFKRSVEDALYPVRPLACHW